MRKIIIFPLILLLIALVFSCGYYAVYFNTRSNFLYNVNKSKTIKILHSLGYVQEKLEIIQLNSPDQANLAVMNSDENKNILAGAKLVPDPLKLTLFIYVSKDYINQRFSKLTPDEIRQGKEKMVNSLILESFFQTATFGSTMGSGVFRADANNHPENYKIITL